MLVWSDLFLIWPGLLCSGLLTLSLRRFMRFWDPLQEYRPVAAHMCVEAQARRVRWRGALTATLNSATISIIVNFHRKAKAKMTSRESGRCFGHHVFARQNVQESVSTTPLIWYRLFVLSAIRRHCPGPIWYRLFVFSLPSGDTGPTARRAQSSDAPDADHGRRRLRAARVGDGRGRIRHANRDDVRQSLWPPIISDRR
jgi:hypothetical protein